MKDDVHTGLHIDHLTFYLEMNLSRARDIKGSDELHKRGHVCIDDGKVMGK